MECGLWKVNCKTGNGNIHSVDVSISGFTVNGIFFGLADAELLNMKTHCLQFFAAFFSLILYLSLFLAIHNNRKRGRQNNKLQN